MTVLPENDLIAIGQLAAQLRRPVRQIEAACLELNILPAKRINFVPYLDGNAVERIAARLADPDKPLPPGVSDHMPYPAMPELRRP